VLFRPGLMWCLFRLPAMTGAWKGGRPQRLVPGAQARWPGHGGIDLVTRAAGTPRTTDKKETAVVADAKRLCTLNQRRRPGRRAGAHGRAPPP